MVPMVVFIEKNWKPLTELNGRFGQTTLLKVCTKMILRELLQRQESLITI